jgi:hypothetical protein
MARFEAAGGVKRSSAPGLTTPADGRKERRRSGVAGRPSAAASCAKRTIRLSAATSTSWWTRVSQPRESRPSERRSRLGVAGDPAGLRKWRDAGLEPIAAGPPLSRCYGRRLPQGQGAEADSLTLRALRPVPGAHVAGRSWMAALVTERRLLEAFSWKSQVRLDGIRIRNAAPRRTGSRRAQCSP